MTTKRIQFIEKLRQRHPTEIREIASENFTIFSDLVTYNWIQGNQRADWHGKSFDWHPTPDHFQDWNDRIHAFDLNMFLAARKHTKTTFSCAKKMYRSEYIDGHSTLYWANTEGQVKERMEELDEMIEANSDWLQNLHTDTALLRKSFENGSRIRTTWVQGAAEGGHVDLSLGDDPMKEFADIPDERIEEWYGKVIVPMLNPDGLHAIVGTRKRPSDLYELLRSKHEQDQALEDLPSYTLTEYPAIREAWQEEYDRPGDLAPEKLYSECHAPNLAQALGLNQESLHILWPEARPPDWLAKNLGGQGTSYFLREFCMIFKQAEDAIVHRDWIARTASDRSPPTGLSEAWTPMNYPDPVTRSAFDEVITGIDPAGSGRDRFGFVTVGVIETPVNQLGAVNPADPVVDESDAPLRHIPIRHILDVWQAEDVPPSRFREKMTSLYDRYQPDEIALESNLNGTWVADDDEIPGRVRKVIEPVSTTSRKHSWKDGVPNIGSQIEAGKYRFYTGGGVENMTEDLITALTSIQMNEGELVGHTPDLVMALYMAHKRLSDDSGHVASSRTNLKHGARSEGERERAESDRERRRALKESPLGDAILGDSGSGGFGR